MRGGRAWAILVALTVTAGCVGGDGGDGDGQPRFVPGATVDAGGVAAVGHLDGDGHLDLVTTSGGARVFMGVGDGTFRGGGSPFEAGKTVAAAIGDVDADGAADVVVLTADGRITAIAVDAAEATPGAVLAELPHVPGVANALATVDVDNDGDLDVAVGHSDGLSVLDNEGDGNWSGPRRVHDGTGVLAFTFAFADDDMLLDLVLATADGLVLLVNDDETNGTFHPRADAFPPVPDARTLVVLDFDNDQRLDVLAATGSGLALLRNVGRSTFEDATGDSGLPGSGAFRTAVAFDADNDGWEDVLALDDEGRLSLFRNDGAGAFEERPAAGIASALAWGDFDRDGRVDLIGLGEDASTVFLNKADSGHYLSLDLQGRESNPTGVGAKLTLSTNTFITYRQAGGGGSPAAAGPADVHFGLGAAVAERYALAILWPSGILQFDETERAGLMDRHVVAVESPSEAPWDVC